MYEDLAITLQGTEFDQDMDVSFSLLKDQVAEILDRNNKMDQMFMQCLDRFDEYNDRFRVPLPDLIDQLVVKEREAQLTLTEENRVKQKLLLERDFLEKQLVKLEEEFDNLLDKHRHIMVKSQKIPLRRRQDAKFLQVNDRNQTLPDNLDSSSRVDESSSSASSPYRGRVVSKFRTAQSRTVAKPRNWTHGSQNSFKVHKSTFDTIKSDPVSTKSRKPTRIYTLKQTS